MFLSGVAAASVSAQAQSLKERLELALEALPHPQSVSEFSALPHLASQNQDSTLVCWSFATSSFLESEMKRLGKEPVRLSVMFPVYCGLMEKARLFVRTKGASRFNPGDLFTGVIDIAREYGAMPAEAYEGIKSSTTIYTHNALYADLDVLIQQEQQRKTWDEPRILAQVTALLNKYLIPPPKIFLYKGKKFTPKTFLETVVALPLDEYLMVTSFTYAPFNQFIALRVPDNWKRQGGFFNVPLEIFYQSMKEAVTQGYSVAIDMDNSETSYRMTKQYAFIPPFEVPDSQRTQAEREKEFDSGSTTDDHLMHIVGCRQFGNEEWFLAKDSWRTAWEGPTKGYFFLHASYIRLKVLAFLVHRNGVPTITSLFPQKS
jgi:bleomycin hydrolase